MASTGTLSLFRFLGNWWKRNSGLRTGLLVQPAAQVVLGIDQREYGESSGATTRVSESFAARSLPRDCGTYGRFKGTAGRK
ncbi:unnamed protein product [Ixodes hexagonus]